MDRSFHDEDFCRTLRNPVGEACMAIHDACRGAFEAVASMLSQLF